MFLWLCSFDYVPLVMFLWLCSFDYVPLVMFLWLCSFGYVPLVMFLCASRGDWGFYFSSQMITSSEMTQSSRCSGVKPTWEIPCGDFGKKELEMLPRLFAGASHSLSRCPWTNPTPAKISYPRSPCPVHRRIAFAWFILWNACWNVGLGLDCFYSFLFSSFFFFLLFTPSKCVDLTNSLKDL